MCAAPPADPTLMRAQSGVGNIYASLSTNPPAWGAGDDLEATTPSSASPSFFPCSGAGLGFVWAGGVVAAFVTGLTLTGILLSGNVALK